MGAACSSAWWLAHGAWRGAGPRFWVDWARIVADLAGLQAAALAQAPWRAGALPAARFQLDAYGLIWGVELPRRMEAAIAAASSSPSAAPQQQQQSASRASWGGLAALVLGGDAGGDAGAMRVFSPAQALRSPAAARKMAAPMAAPAPPVSRDLVLVGGGHSHAFVIKNLGMKPEPGLAVTLITPQVDTPYSGMLPAHIAGEYTREECHIDLVRLCQFGRVRLVVASATAVDLENKVVHVDDPQRPPIRYDVLSIDIGSAPRIADEASGSGMPQGSGALQATPVKPIWQFSERWDALVQSIEARAKDTEKAEVGAEPDELTIGVVGAGAGGVELALSMQHRLAPLSSPKLKIQFVLVSNKDVVCPSHSRAVQKKFARILAERGVSVVLNFEVVGLEESRLRARDGRIVNVDECIWCTSARTQEWMGAAGLAVDKGGFIRVKQTLESESTPNVFAAGDCANMLTHPRPKAGVFAVRQGPPLAANLRRAVRNLNRPASSAAEVLEEFIPQKSFLGLIGTGRPYCVASRGQMALEGQWLWKMKDYIDRKWMAGYTTELPVMAGEAHADQEDSQSLEALTQASLMRCGGCGAKVGKSVLDRVVQNLNPPTRAEVEVGLDAPDDCAVVQFDTGNERAPKVVQTVDYFRSFVDDPFVFGQIAANHALSDCHAMCAEAVTAMAIAVVPFAAERVVEGTLTQLMAGANVALRASDCALVGGHSCEGKDLALGLSVSGVVQPGQRILTKGGVQDGDALIITKPVGTGTLFAANMRVLAKGAWVEGAIESMIVSNRDAALLARDHGATACTDITGFGVIGHLVEMMQASEADLLACLNAEEVPMLEGAVDCVEAGIFSSLQPQNTRLRRAVLNHAQATASHPARYPLLYDPQTSGGLLISVPSDRAEELIEDLRGAGYPQAAIVGHVERDDMQGDQRVKIE